ncbi:AAA family ATPase [Azospirillum doebereinerae]|uniref:DUF2813 domain-containing protein n=1 Tax=Azospirillum doebereinerae TaxID=92933 RepID=A0A3S0WI41_9PROT|nr:AAA family ATPase [Azospirillum doebereinerae]RUQ61986.1 DUF2813 domain-containing protein [Azospirillum doebereinerae]
MLKKLEINGFKTIRQAELEFGRVNIFIGGNGSGKSNILEAMGVLSAALKDISVLELQKRGVRLSVPTLFKSAFKNTHLKSNFSFKAEFENDVHYDVSIKAGLHSDSLRFFTEHIHHAGTTYMGRGPAGVRILGVSAAKKDMDPTRGLWDRFRETIDIPESLEAELNRMATFAIYAPQTAFLRGTDIESVPIKPIGLQGGGLPQAALNIIHHRNQLFLAKKLKRYELINNVLELPKAPGWTDRFAVSRFNAQQVPSQVRTGDSTLYFIDKFMRLKRNRLSAYDSSEGTLYLLFIALLLIHPESPKIFALDNVDNALNPAMTTGMLETLIRVICNQDFRNENIGPDQVFLTSHNPTALDAFDIFDPDQRIFVVFRDKNTGETNIKPLKPKKGMTRADWIKQKSGKLMSELWIEGKITGALGL